jgi:protein tyrosine/serine phosphatase
MRTAIALATIIAASGLAVWWAVEHQRDRLVWDHFDEVKAGVLYRSGQLTPGQLREAVGRYGIRTVVSFLRPGAEVEAERTLARQLGVDFLNLPMPGDGFGREDQFREALAAIDDPERRPVLVHCARGTCRTGAIVALYRFERDGWTVEDVDREMERQVYRQGYLAGYVYEMVAERPFAELFEPRVRLDRNRPEPDRVAARRDTEATIHAD